MFARGLRTKIAINISILLFLGMLLIDMVTIATIKRELIRAEVLKANMLLLSFEKSLLVNISADHSQADPSPNMILAQMLGDPQLAAVLVLNRKGLPVFEHRNPDIGPERLIQCTREAMSSNQKDLHFTGAIRGLFFKQTANLTLAAPLVGSAMKPPARASAWSSASTSARRVSSPAHASARAAARSSAGRSATSMNTRRTASRRSSLAMVTPHGCSESSRYSTARAYDHNRAAVRDEIPRASAA